MAHTARSRAAVGFLLLTLLIFPCATRGQPAAAGLPVYVSDQFKALAQRAFREVVAAEIADACPVDKPLCEVVATRLAEAVDAALRKDETALQAALDGFFFDSSANGLLQLSLSGILEAKELSIGEAVRPVVRCLSAALTDKPLRTACALGQEDSERLLSVIAFFADKHLAAPARADIDAFAASLATARVDPLLALDALAAIAGDPSSPIRRPDVRVYLRRLRSFYALGFERGVSDAVYRFLTATVTESDRFIEGVLVDYEPGETPTQILDDGALEQWTRDVATCGLPPQPIARWKEGRVAYLENLRMTVLSGGTPDFALMDEVIAYRDDCGDAKKLESIRSLKRFMRYFKAPIESYSAVLRYGTAGLAIAGIIDFVRDHDEARLDRNLARAFVYGVAHLGLQRRVLARLKDEKAGGKRLKQDEMLLIGDGLQSCEISALAGVLSVDVGDPPRSHPAVAGRCLSLVSAKDEAAGALPKPAPGESPASWFRANRAELARRFGPLFQKGTVAAEQRGWLDEAHVEALSKAYTYMQEGDSAAARKAVIRLGLDLLMAKLDAATTSLVGGPSEKLCQREFKRSSIFESVGAGCTAHLLIVGAYRPIADYYWATGAAAKKDGSVASAVYRSVLASPALDHTPLILNVGLGGTYVVGNSSVWGKNGYAALTVLDKVGVAFLKVTEERSQFEFGAYVGGFLDALIRTAADTGKEQRYWQAGLTVGWPRISRLPVGIELHAALALPFDLGATERYAFATGMSVVVPFSWFFDNEGK